MDAAIKLLLMALLMGLFILVMGKRAESHDIYMDWKIPGSTMSCCSERDCYPTEAKFEDGRWFALRREDGLWMEVPDRVVLKDGATPEGSAHLCAPPPLNPQDFRIYCFRPPYSGG